MNWRSESTLRELIALQTERADAIFGQMDPSELEMDELLTAVVEAEDLRNELRFVLESDDPDACSGVLVP